MLGNAPPTPDMASIPMVSPSLQGLLISFRACEGEVNVQVFSQAAIAQAGMVCKASPGLQR